MRQLTKARVVLALASVWALCVVSAVASQAQTVWSGVYTEAQAYRGEKVVQTSCAGCHGSGLDGGDSGPKLVGATFLTNWSSQSVAELFDYVRESMPADAPGTLSKEDAAAALAYIFKLNKMPEGRQDLSTNRDELTRIEIVAEKP